MYLLFHPATADLTMFGPANLFNFQMLGFDDLQSGQQCFRGCLCYLQKHCMYPLFLSSGSILGVRGISGKKNVITISENLVLNCCFILVVLKLNGTVGSFLPFPSPYKLITNLVLQHF